MFENPGRDDWPDELLCAFYGGEFLYTQRIAITQRFKYVFNGFDFDEMYDLDQDPQELHNTYGDPASAGIVKKLKEELRRLKKEVGDQDQFADSQPPAGVDGPPR